MRGVLRIKMTQRRDLALHVARDNQYKESLVTGFTEVTGVTGVTGIMIITTR